MTSVTQKTRIRKYLQKGNTLTKEQALNLFGVRSLTARVKELRRDGVFIVTSRRNGETVYRLAQPNKQFVANLASQIRGARFFRDSVLTQN